ncbi:MAG TPA: ABC transporter permease [Vicinamibacterales bacterium]|nr:ABC transporter permease [Vicinamibacterales bacterium]
MRATSRPPRLARWFLERALPGDVREDVSGDVDEMFHRRVATDGPIRSRLWYWGQVLSFFFHFFAARLRDRREQIDMSTGFSWIDVKLALRMLVRYPGLTIIAVVGMAVGMTISAGAFTIVYGMLDPSLALDEGERIVSLVNMDAATNNRESRLMRDYAVWREELKSVQDLGATRNVARNLIAPGAQPETITAAEMTASGFRIARVQPALGRFILPEDERPGAADVVVIGHDVWERRFGSDPAIVGQSVQLGNKHHAIVGVMPKGFAFPTNHSYWIPWHQDPLQYEQRSGPSVNVFGRLAPGASLESAQAELTAIAARIAAANPKTHEHIRSRMKPYTFGYSDMDETENYLMLQAIQTAVVLLLVIVCVNVGILVYARTATRQGEIAVRTALGASRRRVVGQLFIEALVLAALAAVVGIGLTAMGLKQVDAAIRQLAGRLPFWMDFELSIQGAIYVIALTFLAAAIVGIVPALKATGGRVQSRLQGLSAGGGGRMQMGSLWTLLIVAQVAFTVALLPATMYHAWNSLKFRTGNMGVGQEFLTAGLSLDGTTVAQPIASKDAAFDALYATRLAELERRLEAESAVSNVTFSMVDPGNELALVLEAQGMPAPADRVDYNIVEGSRQGHLVRFNRIAPDLFSAFDVPILLGRALHAGDIAGNGVVVNRTLATRLFGGASALGQRIRYVGRSREAFSEYVALDRWYEIVGVVPDFPKLATLEEHAPAVLYHAANVAEMYPAKLAVRVRGTQPSAFAGRLRELSAAVDPNLQLRDVASMQEVAKREQGVMRVIGVTLIVVMSSVIVLSAAGIYALMSFTVARRRKEIGIRTALGADPSRILRSIFSRALLQLSAGAVLGMIGAVGLEQILEGETFQGHGAVILPAVAVLMTLVGLAAAIGPARRGLRIHPTEALRAE